MKKCFSFHPNSSQIFVGVVIGIALASVIIVFTGSKLSQRQIRPGVVKTPIPTPFVIPFPTRTPEPTAGWKTFLSPRCNFSGKVPLEWSVKDIELVPGTDNPNYHYGCIFISAPDYKIVGETQEGLGLFSCRTIPGAKFK